MKKFIVAASTLLAISGSVVAQTSQFEGWSGTAGLGYQSLKGKMDNAVDAANNKYTYSQDSASSGVMAKLGLDYTWAINTKYVLTTGIDYTFKSGSTQTWNIYNANGAVVSTGTAKTGQNSRVSIAPGWLVDNNTLAYLKLGYVGITNTSTTNLGETKMNSNAYTYGFGARFLQKDGTFYFAELNSISGTKKSFSSGGLTGDTKGNGYDFTFGVGKRF